jgi:hypothetical protein
MLKHTFYIHPISGDIATLTSWRDDYESMDIELWHGKPAEECDPKDWLEDSKLIVRELTVDGACSLTNEEFPGWWGSVRDGEKYLSEWGAYAKDEDGEHYMIIWRFPVIKGQEPENDDEWPWDNQEFIHTVEAL